MRLLILLLACLTVSISASPSSPTYETRAEHDPNGIGKFYLGREIAQVMGHQAAGWLERPERETEERTDLLLAALKLKTGEAVADIGAGSGYFSWRMAQTLAPTGKVFAVDIQQEMLDLLARNVARRGVSNVIPVLGTTTNPNLAPESVDTMLLVDVYHEFDQPYEMLKAMLGALKKNGRIVLVEFRGEDPKVNIKRVHKMTEAQARLEFELFTELRWQETLTVLPQQHVIIFKKN
ncbi:MAG: methyltransferase domain-containing protein [Verrucomicrobia bacterium]|nr:methyltransferase domain-containing protein [Verrucomicrobiota bacterium]